MGYKLPSINDHEHKWPPANLNSQPKQDCCYSALSDHYGQLGDALLAPCRCCAGAVLDCWPRLVTQRCVDLALANGKGHLTSACNKKDASHRRSSSKSSSGLASLP